MITIRCVAGFGSRLMRLFGGLAVSRMLGHEPYIHWPRGYECDCQIHKLFSTENIKQIPRFNRNKYDAHIIEPRYASHYTTSSSLIPYNTLYRTMNICSKKTLSYHSLRIPDIFTEDEILEVILKCCVRKDIVESALNFIEKYNIDSKITGLVVRLGDLHRNDTIKKAIDIIKTNKQKTFFVTSDERLFISYISMYPNVIVSQQTIYPTTYLNKILYNAFHPDLAFRDMSGDQVICYRDEQSVVQSFITMLILSRTTIHNCFIQRDSHFRIAAEKFYKQIDLRYFLR